MSLFNLSESIDWQRSKAETLIKTIKLKEYWYKRHLIQELLDWYDHVFNLETANDFGLEVWSLILNVPLYGYTEVADENYPAFGFGALPRFRNFGRGVFASHKTKTYSFTREQKRIALKLKALIINMNGSARDINEKLKLLFGKDQIYMIDNFDMTISYVVKNNDIFGFEKELVRLDLFPRPSGVSIKAITQQ